MEGWKLDLAPSVVDFWNYKDQGLNMGKGLTLSEPQLYWSVKWGS